MTESESNPTGHLARLSDERRYEMLIQAVVDYAIYMIDPNGVVTNWNSGAERIKGYSAQEIIGQNFSVFYAPEDVEAGLPQRALRTAAAEGRYEAEGWRRRKDGTRFWASVVVDAIRDDSGAVVGFAKVTRDVSDRREAEQRLAETREQLLQAQKMEALGQLTGGLAHDFNNLLTTILGGAELARRQIADTPRVEKLLDNIRDAAQRGAALTKQLLAFARRQPLKAEVVDIGELLNRTSALLRHSLPANVELVLEVSDQVSKASVDPAQLELALLNLGFNARDAMPRGGQLRIAAHNVLLDSPAEDLLGGHVAIRVTDTGAGIPEEIRDRILEPFFTTKGFGQGTGLGLSQAYGFAKQSHGNLTVESEVGKGTTVSLFLPAASALGVRADHVGAPMVLVVEDDEAVASLAVEIVREIGYESAVARSAAEALAALDRAARIDLVFSDVVMPGGSSGIELARRIRSRFPELPVLLTTGYSGTIAQTPSEFPLISKPYQIDDLAEALKRLIDPRSSVERN